MSQSVCGGQTTAWAVSPHLPCYLRQRLHGNITTYLPTENIIVLSKSP